MSFSNRYSHYKVIFILLRNCFTTTQFLFFHCITAVHSYNDVLKELLMNNTNNLIMTMIITTTTVAATHSYTVYAEAKRKQDHNVPVSLKVYKSFLAIQTPRWVGLNQLFCRLSCINSAFNLNWNCIPWHTHTTRQRPKILHTLYIHVQDKCCQRQRTRRNWKDLSIVTKCGSIEIEAETEAEAEKGWND